MSKLFFKYWKKKINTYIVKTIIKPIGRKLPFSVGKVIILNLLACRYLFLWRNNCEFVSQNVLCRWFQERRLMKNVQAQCVTEAAFRIEKQQELINQSICKINDQNVWYIFQLVNTPVLACDCFDTVICCTFTVNKMLIIQNPEIF